MTNQLFDKLFDLPSDVSVITLEFLDTLEMALLDCACTNQRKRPALLGLWKYVTTNNVQWIKSNWDWICTKRLRPTVLHLGDRTDIQPIPDLSEVNTLIIFEFGHILRDKSSTIQLVSSLKKLSHLVHRANVNISHVNVLEACHAPLNIHTLRLSGSSKCSIIELQSHITNSFRNCKIVDIQTSCLIHAGFVDDTNYLLHFINALTKNNQLEYCEWMVFSIVGFRGMMTTNNNIRKLKLEFDYRFIDAHTLDILGAYCVSKQVKWVDIKPMCVYSGCMEAGDVIFEHLRKLDCTCRRWCY